MARQTNPNVFFALLLKPIKFTAKKSPDYKAPPPSLLILPSGVCIHVCTCVCMPPRAMLRADQVGMWHTFWLCVCLSPFQIHMGAALIKSSRLNHSHHRLLGTEEKKKNPKNLLVFCQVIWQNQRVEFTWVCVNVREREGGVIEAAKWLCLCVQRARGSEPACRERNINSGVCGWSSQTGCRWCRCLRARQDFVGRVNSGGWASCHARPPRWAGRRAARPSRSGCLSQQFPGLIESKQYKCVPPLAPDPITPRGSPPAPSISTAAETYYGVISEVALAPDLFPECIPSILPSRFIYLYFFLARTCTTEVTCALIL